MESFVFLLVLIQTLVVSSENFKNDDLVFFGGGAKRGEGNFTWGENQRPVVDYVKGFTSHSFWSPSYLDGNSQCKIHMDVVLQEADRLNLWALKMLDSSAKLPSGILSGNLNQLGDFDECLSSEGLFEDKIIKGKYCLTAFELKVNDENRKEKNKVIDDMMHSHRMLTNELTDLGHRIPRLETFNWGICIPASCTGKEIQLALDNHLKDVLKGSSFTFQVSVSDEVCYVNEDRTISTSKAIVMFIFAVILASIILGTLLDSNKISLKNGKVSKALMCFSLKKSWSTLMKTETADDDIKCVHGIRFLNAIALLLSHKEIAMLFVPMVNRTAMAETLSGTWTMIGRSAILYTDSFILISGLLASYSLIKDLDAKKGMNYKDKLISRIVRFLPNLFGIILFCTYIMPDMSSGPQWGLLVDKYANLCKRHMWRNFLFIHNYFGFENMCLTHTHQLGIDMQLFLLSPIFTYLLWKSFKIGSLFILLISVVSTWLRYNVTYRENLSTLLYYGISVDRLWRTANQSYILPTHRLTVYLIGISLGYYLRRGGKSLNLNHMQVVVGWILACIAGLIAVFGPYQASLKEYVYNVNDAAYFNAFAPVLWVGFISWGILAGVNGYGGRLNDFFCWKYFTVFTRISYAVYLTQFPIFFYNVATERSPQYFKEFQSLFNILEFGVILIASVILTLTFDIPFQELKKWLKTESSGTGHMKVEEQTGTTDTQLLSQENESQLKRRVRFVGT